MIGRTHSATWNWSNEQGGVNGRKVKFLSHDDAYTPAKAIEQVRRLVEEDDVACLCNTLGTAANSGFLKYVNQKHIPDLFVGSGADKFQDPKTWPRSRIGRVQMMRWAGKSWDLFGDVVGAESI